MSGKRLPHALLLLLVLFLAAALRFHALDGQSLWNDEGTSVAVAQRPLATIAGDAAADIHPPLYYWLLHGWVRLLGTGEAAVRSLSALLGVALVAVSYALGMALAGRPTALVAALLAALSPFQVYYSQEARMYMLLALLGAGTVLALVAYARGRRLAALVALVLLQAGGLYTHYSFAFVVLILNLAFALSLRRGTARLIPPWAAGQATVGLLYLPWLPIALRQVRVWPGPEQAMTPLTALTETWRWLVVGPTLPTAQGAVSLTIAAGAVAAGGVLLWGGRRATSAADGTGAGSGWAAWLLGMWLVLPVGLMLALGLYREAYLKFLLVASPALCLALACGLTLPNLRRSHAGGRPVPSRAVHLGLRSAQALAALAIVALCALGLRNYYCDPAYARDDYRGIAAYVQALGRPGDAIVLNAPGQQEVFGYYYRGMLPVSPLPVSRPADRAATEAALARLATPGGRIFAVLWATGESDPERIVEGWLESNTYQALDSWVGRLRLAVYAVPVQVPSAPDRSLGVALRNPTTGDEVRLEGYSLPPRALGGIPEEALAAGDIAQIALFWQATQGLERPYKAFVHLLDEADHIAGQRDAELRLEEGRSLTSLWGVPVHPTTPPGTYRVVTGVYDAETGQRLVAPGGASVVWLEPLTVVRPDAPAPMAALGMQHRRGRTWDALRLLGYDAHKLGFDHQPDTPLRPGDLLHVKLYWQALGAPGAGWQVRIDLIDASGQARSGIVTEPVATYPTGLWQAHDVWRGQHNLAIPGDAPAGRYRLRVQPIASNGVAGEPFLSDVLRIEP